MILFSQFGYALRHRISYDPKSKPGNLRLWASNNGSAPVPDPVKNGDSALTEFLAHQFLRSPIFGADMYVDLPIGNDDDLFSILAAVMIIKERGDYSFKNFTGRMISFSRSKASNNSDGVILVNILHDDNTGMITLKEIDELEFLTRSILTNLGYSNQEIAEKAKTIITISTIQQDENAKKTG